MVYRITALLVVLFSFQGCQKVMMPVVDYSLPSIDNGNKCITQCQNVRSKCNQNCDKSINICLKQKKADALDSFERYKVLVNENPKFPERDFNSFYNTLQCDTPTCRCEVNYRACYELCGGQVTESNVCLEHCD